MSQKQPLRKKPRKNNRRNKVIIENGQVAAGLSVLIFFTSEECLSSLTPGRKTRYIQGNLYNEVEFLR